MDVEKQFYQTEIYTMANIKMMPFMVLEYILQLIEWNIQVNFKKEKKMINKWQFRLKVDIIEDNLKMINLLVIESNYLQMDKSILVIIKITYFRVLESILMKIDKYIKVNSIKEKCTVKVK